MINFFKEISRIPRPSYHEEKIVAYLENFAEQRNLEFYTDTAKNIIIKKPASPDKQFAPPLILQAHTDMVCEKNAHVDMDFLCDPISIIQSCDTITADGTTLGADDGIGIAMILKILDSRDISHPPLECLFTSAEEVGMVGAKSLCTKNLTAKALINLDTEEEGYFITGCAGGGNFTITFDATKSTVPKDFCHLDIEVLGLAGGHSGTDINKGRLNSNVLLAEVLSDISEDFDIMLVSIGGGLRDNAIPRESKAVIAVPKELQTTIQSRLQQKSEMLTAECAVVEPGLTILIAESSQASSIAYSNSDTMRLVNMICRLPNGVVTMEKSLPDLVETSLSLGVLSSDTDKTKFTYHIRSSSKKQFSLLKEQMSTTVYNDNHDSCWSIDISGEYPAWEYKEDSALTKKAVSAYQALYEADPIVTTIHAGLECGIIAEQIPGLDVISIGPDITGAHSPGETLDVASANRTYDLLKKILEDF